MESFHWDKNFETGLTDVDHQHRHLVDLINQFGEMLTGNELVFDDIEKVFKELADYAQYHFDEEEELMRQVGIDQRHFDLHIDKHHNFLNEVKSMHSNISPENEGSVKILLGFLTKWLAFHILCTDQNLARQIEAINKGVSPVEAYETEEIEADSSTQPLLVALNGLFEQVSEQNRELVELNKSLEVKVADRTKALSEANRYLEEISLTDVLTGLPNRRHALRQLSYLWDESIKHGSPLTCMMIDADHFKQVNDTYGHDAGDLVLRELAKTIQYALRSDDIACRLGGDEFFVVCPNTDKEGGLHLGELIRKTVSELRVPTGDGAWHGSISVGLATRSADMENSEDFIKVADEGVYVAKHDGKNCVRTTN